MADLLLAHENYQRTAYGLPPATLVNWVVEDAPESPDRPFTLIPRPGYANFATLSGGTAAQGIFYADNVQAGRVVAVSGGNVYKVFPSGTVTSLGTITETTDPVRFAATLNELFVTADGSLYEVEASTTTGFSPSALTGETVVDIAAMVGRLIVLTEDGDFYWSNVLDGQTIGGLSFANAERSGDGGVAIIADKQELWIFGTETIEVWGPTSQSAEYAFDRVVGAELSRGCASRDTTLLEDNSVWWLGDDGVFYRANGYSPTRMSTHGQEQRFREEIAAGNSSQIRAWSFTLDGHKYIGVRTPNQGTHVFDIATGAWSEWQTGGATFEPFMCLDGPSDPHCLTDGAVGRFGADRWSDAGTAVSRTVTAHAPVRSHTPCTSITVDVTTDSSDTLLLEISDDQGASFVSAGTQALGAARWIGLGQMKAPGRIFRVSTSTDEEHALRGVRVNDIGS